MFNMTKIGKKICSLRKEQNMTQVELADRLGISYQAVSNWERGNSMPDISKLPELATIFNISLDDLIGEKSVLVEAAVNNELVERIAQNEISEEDVDNVLPLLKPSQVETIVKDSDLLRSKKHKINVTAFLPYMNEDDVQDLALTAFEDGKSVKKFLPFMNEDDIMALAEKAFENGQSVTHFLPFINKDQIRKLADRTLENGMSIKTFFPFLCKKDLRELTLKSYEKGESINAFLPFLSEDDIRDFVRKASTED